MKPRLLIAHFFQLPTMESYMHESFWRITLCPEFQILVQVGFSLYQKNLTIKFTDTFHDLTILSLSGQVIQVIFGLWKCCLGISFVYLNQIILLISEENISAWRQYWPVLTNYKAIIFFFINATFFTSKTRICLAKWSKAPL